MAVHESLSLEEFRDAMDGTYSGSVVDGVLDEAPKAYKSAPVAPVS